MTYTMIALDFIVVAGLLPRGGRLLPIPDIGGPTIDADPTPHGLEFKVDGGVVLIPWARVQWTQRAATPVHAPGAEAFARAVIAAQDVTCTCETPAGSPHSIGCPVLAVLMRPPAPVRQPAPREKRK